MLSKNEWTSCRQILFSIVVNSQYIIILDLVFFMDTIYVCIYKYMLLLSIYKHFVSVCAFPSNNKSTDFYLTQTYTHYAL